MPQEQRPFTFGHAPQDICEHVQSISVGANIQLHKYSHCSVVYRSKKTTRGWGWRSGWRCPLGALRPSQSCLLKEEEEEGQRGKSKAHSGALWGGVGWGSTLQWHLEVIAFLTSC